MRLGQRARPPGRGGLGQPATRSIALATEAFDVVIVDDQMPGFDPLEVTEMLHWPPPGPRRRPAVVVVSADLDVVRRAALFRAGVAEVVTRPLGLAPLHGLLTRIARAGAGAA